MAARTSDRTAERLLAVLEEPNGSRAEAHLDEVAARTGRPAWSLLLNILTHMSPSEEEARSLLLAAFRHREDLKARLGRDVGVRVALFDLIVSVQRRLTNPVIIDLPAFERIERSAITDHLTALFNRSYFESRLAREIRRARRYGQSLSLLMMDLDDFKAINDKRGHVMGDMVLRDVGRLILEHVRDIDIAARYGGEEFAVILPETPRRGALVVAERIRGEMERHFRRKGAADRPVRLTVSGGLACFPEDAEAPEALVARADEALYRAKSEGKNVIVCFFEEKRRDERVAVGERRLKAILVEAAGDDLVRRSGRVKNISEGGLLVELNEPVPVGSELQVSFALGPEAPVRIPSKVVRITESPAEGKRRRFEAGLRFQKRARILGQLHRLARQQAAAS